MKYVARRRTIDCDLRGATMRTRASWKRLSVILSVSLNVACRDVETPTAPSNPVKRSVPDRPTESILQSLPIFSAPLMVEGSNLPLPTYSFNEGVKVEIKIEGLVTVRSDPRAPYVNKDILDLDGKGIWVGTIYNTCFVAAKISYPSATPRSEFGPGNGCTYPRDMKDYIDTGVVRGSGTAIRTFGIPEPSPGVCDTIDCHTYSGSQLITIRPLLAKLDFKGSYGSQQSRVLFLPPFVNDSGRTLIGFQPVVFTDSTFPKAMPFQPLFHSWVFADPMTLAIRIGTRLTLMTVLITALHFTRLHIVT